MLKASAGGGGKGMRIVQKAKELLKAWKMRVKNLKPPLTMMTCILKNFLRILTH